MTQYLAGMTAAQWQEMQVMESMQPTAGQTEWLLACLCSMVYGFVKPKGASRVTAEDFYFQAPPSLPKRFTTDD